MLHGAAILPTYQIQNTWQCHVLPMREGVYEVAIPACKGIQEHLGTLGSSQATGTSLDLFPRVAPKVGEPMGTSQRATECRGCRSRQKTPSVPEGAMAGGPPGPQARPCELGRGALFPAQPPGWRLCSLSR